MADTKDTMHIIYTLTSSFSSLHIVFASLVAIAFHCIRSIFSFAAPCPVKLNANESSSGLVDAREGHTTVLEMVKARCPSLYGKKAVFKPVWWLPGGHVQTIWCVVAEMFFRDSIPFQRQLVRTADGGTLSLDVYPPFDPSSPSDASIPMLFVLHGLTGTTQESYTRATVKELCMRNPDPTREWRVVAMNFRGCDVDTPVTSPRLYHAGETDDTRTALLWLSTTYPDAPLYGLGFSMGASTMAKYLGEEGERTPLKGAVCVSNPFDWVIATHYIEHGSFLNKYLYGPILADALLTMFKNSRYAYFQPPPTSSSRKTSASATFDPRLSLSDIYSKRYVNIRWFDDRVTAPCFGFSDGWDYYTQASSTPFITSNAIKVPHLSLHSDDDPMVLWKNLPSRDVERRSEWVVMATTKGGGHVGWFEDKETRWFTKAIREFCEAIQDVQPEAKPSVPSLPLEPSTGLVRSAELPNRVGFRLIGEEEAKGLMTAKMYNSWAHAPILGGAS